MKQLELIAPAGDWDCFKAAVYNGANAVYLGIQFFNARRLANNFKVEELPEIVFFAHLHYAKIYLTLNTLVRNEEILLWFKTLEQAYLAGIDGVIIQEVAFVPFIKKYFPDLKIHASTQTSLMNAAGINKFDFDLVILARELTTEEIAYIRRKTNVALEMFVHGHLCVSYSGQCLISSLIGKRSGNRGICASSCRKPYNGNCYLISPKDLMLANELDEIASLGISAVKIEGRMKSPEYVGITTKTYRQQIDSLPRLKPLTSQQLDNLRMGFNREFTTGFFGGNKSIIGSEMPMNRGIPLGTINFGKLKLQAPLQLHDGVSFWHRRFEGKLPGGLVKRMLVRGQEVQRAAAGEVVVLDSPYFIDYAQVYLTSQNKGVDLIGNINYRTFPVKVTGKKDQPLLLKSGDCQAQSEIPLQQAQNQALTSEQIITELKKSERLGIRWQVSLDLEPGLFMPKRFFREAREALEEELKKKTLPIRYSQLTELPTVKPAASVLETEKPQLIVKVYSLDQLKEANALGVYAIYYDVFKPELEQARQLCTNAKFFVDTPVVLNDKDIDRIEQIIKKVKPGGICIGNWGLLNFHFSGEKHGKYSLNTFNDLSAQMLREHKVLPMVSVELSAAQVLKMENKELIYYAHGRLPVMHLKGIYPERALTDERGYTFPLRAVNGNTEMLYSRPIALYNKIEELIHGGLRHFFLDLEKDTTTIITAYQNIIDKVPQDISMLKKGTTIGNFAKGVG